MSCIFFSFLALAVTFFICEDVKNFLLVMDDYPRMCRTAIAILMSSNIVASLSTIARSILKKYSILLQATVNC